MVRPALVALLLAMASPIAAEENKWAAGDNQSGQWIVDVCAAEGLSDRLVCYQYLRGFRDGLMIAEIRTADSAGICWPEGVSLEQMRRIIVRHGEQHPDELHDDISTFTYVAFAVPFSCKPK